MGKRGKKSKAKAGRGQKKNAPSRTTVSLDELLAIIDLSALRPLTAEEREKLRATIETYAFLTSELEAKGATVRRLRRLLFGSSTEKTSHIFPKETEDSDQTEDSDETASAAESQPPSKPTPDPGQSGDSRPKKRKGHGRRAAEEYRGAEKVRIPHPSLRHGDPCPECPKGKVYRLKEPARLVRVVGMAPLTATVYELERLRCKLCGKVFTAPAPPGVGTAKYDEKAASMIALLKYGCGLPFNRLERLGRELGVPLPAGTQWELVKEAAALLTPAHQELIRQAAQGDVLHNDDTTMKILDLLPRRDEEAPGRKRKRRQRQGTFTSGIVSTADGWRIALFFSGCRHAGENLDDVLARRASNLPPPIQMCDGLPVNHTKNSKTILAGCLAHARRKFVDVAENFPDECRHVLETIKEIYGHEAVAREQKMSPEDRLAYHQKESAPLLEKLKRWMETQIEERKVEPNSGLGGAIAYMLKHWDPLTRFIVEPGAPLDNNIAERALKRAILHRKNALFYKTLTGAQVGDLFMSLIHTAELNGIDVFDYLSALQENAEDVAHAPGAWMPWNYKATLEAGPTNAEA